MNKIILDRISIALIILMMIMLVSAFFYLKSEGKACLSNPYLYGAGKMGNVSCSCIHFNNPICPARFSFNENNFSAGITKCGTNSGGSFDLDLFIE
jgi:hypothetical protein